MAKSRKTNTIDDVAAPEPNDLTRVISGIRHKFIACVTGTYLSGRRITEFLAYLDSLTPKPEAENAAPEPTAKPEPVEPERPDNAAGPPS